MKIIIGLGNPGAKYELTRHNIGFTIADTIAKKFCASKWIKKFDGMYCECWYESEKFFLLKPQTYMNNSGNCVREIVNFYKPERKDIVIIHDELDLEIGKIKLKNSGGHSGHNGLRSIHQAIGDQYARVRIGIGRPQEREQVSSYVLSNFTSAQNIYVEAYKKSILSNLNILLNDNYYGFIESVNTELNRSSNNSKSTVEENRLQSSLKKITNLFVK